MEAKRGGVWMGGGGGQGVKGGVWVVKSRDGGGESSAKDGGGENSAGGGDGGKNSTDGGENSAGDGGGENSGGGAIVYVFWDMENAPKPINVRALHIGPNIQRALGDPAIGWTGPLYLFAFSDYNHVNEKIREEISRGFSMARILDSPAVSKDAGDKKLMTILISLMNKLPPPQKILLITSDGDFCNMVSLMRQHNHSVILAGRTPISESLRLTDNSSWDWGSLAAGNAKAIVAARLLPELPLLDTERDSKPIHIWWDMKSCCLPVNIDRDRKNMEKLVELFQLTFRKMQWWGPMQFFMYAQAGSMLVNRQCCYQNNHINILHVTIGSKYNSSKIMTVDMINSLMYNHEESRFLVISNANFTDAALAVLDEGHEVVVARNPCSFHFDYGPRVTILDWTILLSP